MLPNQAIEYINNKFAPSNYDRGGSLLTSIGVLSTFIYIYTKLWTPISVNRFFDAILILTFIIAFSNKERAQKHKNILIVIGIAITLPLILFAINYILNPEIALKYTDGHSLDRFAKMMYVIPVAWWLGGSTDNWLKAFYTFVFGLITGILLQNNLIINIQNLVEGNAISFGLKNKQHEAMYFGFLLITSTVFFKYISETKNRVWLTINTIAFLIGLIGILGAQTRAAWLGILISIISYPLISLYINKVKAKKLLIYSTIAIVSIGFASLLEPVQKRLTYESKTIEKLKTFDIESVPYTSIGIRIQSWHESINWIIEKPIIGWGYKAKSDVIDSIEGAPNWVKEQFGHLHNSYLEILLGYGLIGFLFTSLLGLIIIKESVRLRNIEQCSFNITIFTLTFFVFFLVINNFESYLLFWNGTYLASVAFSLILTKLIKSNECIVKLEKTKTINTVSTPTKNKV